MEFKETIKEEVTAEMGFADGSVVKNLSADAANMGPIPGLQRSPGEGNVNPLHILVWRIPWNEDPGGLQSMGSQSRTRLSDSHTDA